MPSPITPPDRTRPVIEEPGETYESIPWESLQDLSRGGENRNWYIAAGVIVALGVAVAVVRGLVAPAPVEIVAVPTTEAAAVTVPTTPPATTPVMVSEADLMAIEPATLERAVAAVAEVAVAEFFSVEADGLWAGVDFGVSRTTFVERVAALAVGSLSPGRFSVTVVVSLLDGDDGEPFVRRPLRAVEIVVETIDGRFRPVDLPRPVPLPIDGFKPPAAVPAPLDPRLLAAAAESVADLGSIAGEPLSSAVLPTGVTRLVLAVTDSGGIEWPYVVYVAPDGSVVPPG